MASQRKCPQAEARHCLRRHRTFSRSLDYFPAAAAAVLVGFRATLLGNIAIAAGGKTLSAELRDLMLRQSPGGKRFVTSQLLPLPT